MKKLLFILLFIFSSSCMMSQNIEGQWNGLLDVRVAKLHLIADIKKEGIVYVGTIDSPDQGAKGIPITKISFQDGTLDFSIETIQASYVGVLVGDSIVGSFTQMGQRIPLVFKRDQMEVKLNRPQNPVEPYSYHSEDVTFYNKEANIHLAGTFTYPKSGQKLPSGSAYYG